MPDSQLARRLDIIGRLGSAGWLAARLSPVYHTAEWEAPWGQRG